MSLEQALNENTVALNALIALIKGGSLSAVSGKAADAGEAKSTKTAKSDDDGEAKTTRRKSTKTEEAKTSKFSAEDVKAAAVKVKDALGTKEAKRLIAEHGAEELAKLKPESYEDFINACEDALKGDDDNGDDDGDGL